MAISFNKENMLAFKEKLESYDCKESLLIPALTMAQNQFGYLSDEVIRYVSQLLQLPETRVLEVVSFYSIFRRRAPAKLEISFCNNLSCQMKGMEELRHYASERAREICRMRGDDAVKINEVSCLGCCDKAPVVMVNRDHQVEAISKEKLEELFSKLEPVS